MQQIPVMLEDERLLKLIDERIRASTVSLGLVTKDELDHRMAEVEKHANDNAGRIVAAAISEAETRLNGTVNHLIQRFDLMVEQLKLWKSGVDDRVNNWSGQIERVQQRQDDADGELEQMRLADTQFDHRIRTLNTTIHGDPEIKDGAPSLFAMMKTMNTNIETLTGYLETKQSEATAIAMSSKLWIETYEERERERKERLARWKKRVGGMVDWLLKNKTIVSIITIILVLILIYFFPDLGPILWPYAK